MVGVVLSAVGGGSALIVGVVALLLVVAGGVLTVPGLRRTSRSTRTAPDLTLQEVRRWR
jgi:hypothetical protein